MKMLNAPGGFRMLALAVLGACGSASVHAAISYDEGLSGDLSGSGLAPTSISLSLGSNQVLGDTGRNVNGAVDRDYLTFVVPTGTALKSLWVLPGTTSGGARGLAFLALEEGPQVTLPTSPASAAGLLGWEHYGPDDIGEDILDNMGVSGAGATGFVPPLPEGTYSVWIQELSTGTFPYAFDFELKAVPEAKNGVLLGGMLAGLIAFRRWKRA
ncbi:MAG: hypothetical protein JNK85_08950 [Verrucomicrobiales bacterium]|nr:hypothetical protein [Verrucomicrobiales bacterium]